MKTLTLSLVLLAFAFASQASEAKKAEKECPDKEFLCAPVFNVMQMPTDNCRCRVSNRRTHLGVMRAG